MAPPVSHCPLPIYALRDRERGERTNKLPRYVQNLLRGNIASQHADIKQLNNVSVYGCIVDGDQVILQTANPCGIQWWDISFAQLKKTVLFQETRHWEKKFFLTDNKKVVCFGFVCNETDPLAIAMSSMSNRIIVKIVSLTTLDQEVSFFIPAAGLVSTAAVIGNRIFAKLDRHGIIEEWNLEGRCVQRIAIAGKYVETCNFYTKSVLNQPALLVSETSLTLAQEKQIWTLENSMQFTYQLSNDKEPNFVKAASNDRWMVFGFSREKNTQNPLFCCAIGVSRGAIQKKYYLRMPCEDEKQNLTSVNFMDECGLIVKIVLQEDWAYLKDSTGVIIALDLNEQLYRIIGQHAGNGSPLLSVDNGILASGLSSSSEIKFWDLDMRVFLGSIALPDILNDFVYKDGKVFAATNQGLIVVDYCRAPKKLSLN